MLLQNEFNVQTFPFPTYFMFDKLANKFQFENHISDSSY